MINITNFKYNNYSTIFEINFFFKNKKYKLFGIIFTLSKKKDLII